MGVEIAPTKLGHTRFLDSDDEESPEGGSGGGCGGGGGEGAGGPGREVGLVLKEGDWTVDRKAASLVGTVLGRGKSAKDPVEVEEDGWGGEGEEDAWEVMDLKSEPFDLYAKLKMPREAKDPRSKSRSCYHRLTARWHPRGFRCRPIVCDGCGAGLTVGPDWFHKKGSQNYDVCGACRPEQSSGEAQRERTEGEEEEIFVAVNSLDVLGEDKEQYERELERIKARDEATVEFAKVSLAYRVLREEERRRIYDTCGWEGLVKAEQYSEVSVFDEDAFEQYESFFSGEDEDDRQYLLIHGPQASDDDDEEEEQMRGQGSSGGGKAEGGSGAAAAENKDKEDKDGDDDDDDDDDDDEEEECAVPEVASSLAREAEAPPMPMPPVSASTAFSVFAAAKGDEMGSLAPNGAWGVIASKVGDVVQGDEGAEDKVDGEAEEESRVAGGTTGGKRIHEQAKGLAQESGEPGKKAKMAEGAVGAAAAASPGSPSGVINAVKCILRDGLPDL